MPCKLLKIFQETREKGVMTDHKQLNFFVYTQFGVSEKSCLLLLLCVKEQISLPNQSHSSLIQPERAANTRQTDLVSCFLLFVFNLIEKRQLKTDGESGKGS